MTQVVVIGDYMTDIDTHLEQVGIAPDHHCPVTVHKNEYVRPGAAGAVVEMLRSFGVHVLPLGEHFKSKCRKHRYFIDGKPIFRNDQDFCDPLSATATKELLECIPESAQYIIISDYGKGMITDSLWTSLVERYKDKIIVDPTKNRSVFWYKGVFGIVPNKIEANVTTVNNGFMRCNQLSEVYQKVALKLGPDGILVGETNKATRHIEGKLIIAKDVCGAGDMVISALVAGLLEGFDWFTACEFANKMAAEKCMQDGATPITAGVEHLFAFKEQYESNSLRL